MPFLEIQSPDGGTELRRLSRRSPVVIGRNPVSDICVDDEGVAPIECRISWNGNSFEVTAVAADGVDVNDVLVRRKELVRGDVLRIGEARFVFRRSADVAQAARAAAGNAAAPKAGGVASSGKADGIAGSSKATSDAAVADGLNDDDWAALADESPAGKSPRAKRTTSPPAAVRGDEPVADDASPKDDRPVLLDDTAATAGASTTATDAAPPPAKAPGALARMRHTKRPGEQDILTSPLVLGLGGLSLVLLLAAGTFWLLMDREAADRVYNAAVADREARRYAQAIRSYEQFLIDYPADKRAADARFALGLTRIESEAGGVSPDFEAAQRAFDEFVRGHRDLDGFDQQREPLRKLARQMTAGAAAAAIRTGERKYLDAAGKSQQLFDRYAPTDQSIDDVRQALAKSLRDATDAVRKKEFFDESVATIDAAIAASDFPTAFKARTNLLTRHPDLASDRRMQSLLARSLDAEKAQVKSIEPDADPPVAGALTGGLTPVGHTQARAGEVSDGRLVFAVARDSLVGLDAVTGKPRWRTTIGLDTPFFPIAVDASVPALLAFDAGRNELLLLRREDGVPIWRTAIGATATGPPHIAQGQIDVATNDGRLLRFVLDTGETVGAVRFPQPIVGPPVLAADGERLVVFGEASTAYTLDLRSLAVQAVSYTGQAAGAIDVPPLALGKLLIVCENDQLETSVVRAFAIDAETGVVRPAAATRINGRIYTAPVARGNLLFVSSSPERITPISVSDDAGQPPLSRLEGTLIPEGRDVPMYLVPGPDGMVWAAGSALRKLRLVAKSLTLLPDSLAPGRHTQPPQESGESLFVARRLPSSPAVFVSQADREAMTGNWRTVVGAALVGLAPSDTGTTLVTDAGQSATVSLDDVAAGGFADVRPLPQWEEDSSEPLHGASLADGRAVVWRGGASPKLWLIPPGGSVAASRPIPAGLECPPVALQGGIVVPVPGRLEWLAEGGSSSTVEAFLLPIENEGEPAPKWHSAARIDSEQFVVADDSGIVRVIRLRAEPLPHLAETASLKLDAPATQPIDADAGRIAVVSGSRVQMLDPSGLRTIADTTRDKPIVGGPWSVGELVFVQDDSHALVACDGESLEPQWTVALDAPLAGRPLKTGTGWTIATRNGTVADLADDGTERSRTSLQAPLAELFAIGERPVAATIGGTLMPIPEPGAATASVETNGEAAP